MGLSQTSTPLDNVTTVTPRASRRRRPVTVPPAGGCSRSWRPAVLSSQGVMATCDMAASAPRTSASVGTVTPSFRGATASTTRLSSWMFRSVTSRTSSSVIVGRSCRTMPSSTSMPGLGSPVRKFDTYSRA